MALANVACLLADRLGGHGSVLLVDWDLEAPGLHRFFPGRVTASAADTSLGLDHRLGLIDLFQGLDGLTPTSRPESDDEAEERAAAALDRVELERFVGESGIGGVRLLRAGRDDDGHYAQRVTTFSWEGLFRRSPALFRTLADRWARSYRYVLVDSRTGVGDISGICTSLLPEKLVVVFTPNRQSLTGIRALVERATTYRRQSDDLRPLVVFPLPSRIEATREDLRGQWRMGNRERGITGYQPMFEELLTRTYGLPECKLDFYFDQVQIQQTPDFAYGEEIAVRAEQATDRFSLNSSFRVFTDWLVNSPAPWRRQSDVDMLIETLKERVGAESLGQEQRRGLEEIVGKLEETVKRDTPAAASTSISTTNVAPSETAQRRFDVFLSYAGTDHPHAARLAAELQRRSLSVFWNRVPVSAARSLDDLIAEALDASRVVIALWSRASAESAWVKSEAAEGLRRGALLSVCLDDVRIPVEFRRREPIDLRAWVKTGAQSDLESLFTSLQPDMPGSAPRPAWHLGRRLMIGLGLVVLASGGGVAYWTTVRHAPTGAAAMITTPTLVGQSLEEAVLALTNAGLKIGRTETQTVTDARPGTVLRQSVTPGDQVARGSGIDLVVATPASSRDPRQQQRMPEQKYPQSQR